MRPAAVFQGHACDFIVFPWCFKTLLSWWHTLQRWKDRAVDPFDHLQPSLLLKVMRRLLQLFLFLCSMQLVLVLMHHSHSLVITFSNQLLRQLGKTITFCCSKQVHNDCDTVTGTSRQKIHPCSPCQPGRLARPPRPKRPHKSLGQTYTSATLICWVLVINNHTVAPVEGRTHCDSRRHSHKYAHSVAVHERSSNTRSVLLLDPV